MFRLFICEGGWELIELKGESWVYLVICYEYGLLEKVELL